MASNINVTQGSIEWLDLRKSRINGSEIASLIGFSSYIDPISSMLKKRHSDEISETTQRFFDHGHKYETMGLAKFIDMMPNLRQTYTLPSGYYTPTKRNLNFLNDDDEFKFGVSLDGEGSLYDVEIKNPYSYFSFKKKYLDTVQIEHFIQCQWAMGIRERSTMFYVATHFDPNTTQFLAIVIWQINFDYEFFTKTLYPLAYKVYNNFSLGQRNDVPWINENNNFTESKVWQELFLKNCKKINSKIEGRLISEIIKNKQK